MAVRMPVFWNDIDLYGAFNGRIGADFQDGPVKIRSGLEVQETGMQNGDGTAVDETVSPSAITSPMATTLKP